jgi:hypothetical protein
MTAIEIFKVAFCMWSLCAAAPTHPQEPALIRQYVADNGNSMTLHVTPHAITISGKGTYSLYAATCTPTSATATRCEGTGTRLKDKKTYQGEYILVSEDEGETVHSTWHVWYDNGEDYRGTNTLSALK